MTLRMIQVAGRSVALHEAGSGASLVYLHGFADVHAAPADLQPFHLRLAAKARLYAPAHPGCAGGAELIDGAAVDDVVFHYLETFDALGLDRFDLVGHCVGGWFAAEIAARHPEKVRSLTLISACGLFVSGQPIADVFMHAQPERGVDYSSLRRLFFSRETYPAAQEWFPNGRADVETEVRRYQMLRFASFVGFRPPYFYNHSLARKLSRARMPAQVIWGAEDHMTPVAHAQAYERNLPHCETALLLEGVGHAAPIEAPEETASAVLNFVGNRSTG